MANLISAYYAKGLDSKSIFDTLHIGQAQDYEEHLNRQNVVSMNMSELPDDCSDWRTYLNFHRRQIKKDLLKEFPNVFISMDDSLWEIFQQVYEETGESFVFVLDEWDSYFHSKFFTEDGGEEYLTFLKNLLKDKPYVELAYMTGIMPIRKYSSGSELNMFDEFYFPTDAIYDSIFGFTEEEVLQLCERNKKNDGFIQYEDLAEWYNGYYTAEGKRLYNPRSINKALNQNVIKNY